MDEEQRETGEPEQIKDSTKEIKQPREPNQADYMAAAILANGIIWFWMESLKMFSGFTSRIHPTFLADLSYLTFIIAGFISSQQVAKRSDRNQLIVALRSSLYSWAGSLFMMITMTGTPTISFALIILVCLLAGAVLGSYMLIRWRIKERQNLLKESS
ncbi:hypothetical protein GF326_08895 [Candidatus Bathyarchaeota archaeon]|nr:hypothetical protein [Candidatus Bathyarchaeota archaeon]